MFNILKWYGKLGITAKQFIFLFGLVFIVFVYLQWSNISNIEDNIRKQTISESQSTVDRTNQFISLYMDNIKNILFAVASRNDLLDEGREAELNKFLSEYIDYNAGTVKTLYVIRSDGQLFSSNSTMLEVYGSKHLNEIIQISQSNPNTISWSEPYRSPLSRKTIAFGMPIRSIGNSRISSIIGYVYAEISFESIENKFFQWFVQQDRTFVITSMQNNLIVYDNSGRLLPPDVEDFSSIAPDYMQKLNKLDEGTSIIDNDRKQLYAIKSRNSLLGWNIYVIIDKGQVDIAVTETRRNFYISMLLWIIVLVSITFFLTYYFTRPVKKLAAVMDKVNDIEKFKPIEVKSLDEIGRLRQSYNSMMKRIQNLVYEVKQAETEKKEYELKMLQSQIGPHFLYNTLACIVSLSRQQKNSEIRETVHALVNLLSFSFDKRDEFVTLEDELDSINSYVYIQKIMHGDIFYFNMKVSPEAAGSKILKLSLQPIVENAIFHGLVPKNNRGHINVDCRIIDKSLVVRVADSGVGMEKECYRSLLDNTQKKNNRKGFNSIGLKNVNDRIKLHFGKEYGLSVLSKKDKGTIVRLRMPQVH